MLVLLILLEEALHSGSWLSILVEVEEVSNLGVVIANTLKFVLKLLDSLFLFLDLVLFLLVPEMSGERVLHAILLVLNILPY